MFYDAVISEKNRKNIQKFHCTIYILQPNNFLPPPLLTLSSDDHGQFIFVTL